MGWLRIKERVSGSPLPKLFERKIQELDRLKKTEEKGEIEIRYVDESGFCLIPYIRDPGQEPKNKIEIKSHAVKKAKD